MKYTIDNFPEESGIYKITSPTGRVYIGEAKCLRKRCLAYTNPNKVKKQRAIYNSLIKYGVESHNIEILELTNEDLLMVRERFYQELYDSVNNGLNCFFTQTDNKKKIWSEETKNIMSQNQKGDKNSFYGKKHTDESLRKIGESSKGDKNPNFGGKLVNKDFIEKQIESNSKKHLKVIDTKTGEIQYFRNSKECAVALNAKQSNVRMCKNSYKLLRRYIITDK